MIRIATLATVTGLGCMLQALPAQAQNITPPAAAAPPAASTPTAAPAPAIDAATLMKRVKQRYTELNPRAMRLEQQVQTVTRSAGQEDVSTSGMFVTYQQGPNARTVMTGSFLARPPEIGATSGYSGPAVGRLEWLRTPAGLQIQYQPVPTGPQDHPAVTTMELPTDRLDPQLRAIAADPLATLQTFDLVGASNPSFREEYLHGVEKYVVTSIQPVPISPGILMDLQLWIGKNSLLVDRMVATLEIRTPEQTTPTFIDFLSDFGYGLDVAIPAGYFTPQPPQQTPPAAVAAPSPNAPQLQPQSMTPSRILDVTPYVLRDRDFVLKNFRP